LDKRVKIERRKSKHSHVLSVIGVLGFSAFLFCATIQSINTRVRGGAYVR